NRAQLSSTWDTEDTADKSYTRRHERKDCSSASTVSSVVAILVVALAWGAPDLRAQSERPPVGPERPFQLAPRVERTLANGPRIIVTRQTVVPKVTVMLTVLSGFSSDPPELTGLAAMTADAVQEGTKSRTSKEIRGQVFGMGGSLSATVSQDFSSLSVR